jgi:hypothetical protein
MNQEYQRESHDEIMARRVNFVFSVEADISRKGKTAKLESVDNPATVFYCQFHYFSDSQPVLALFEVPKGNYILTVSGEDRKEYVTVFPSTTTEHQWW